jgi:predicted enzyme related to lactoylglutathione lyase
MKNNPVGWFEIYVDEMSRAKKFYESVFDLKLEKLPNTNVEMFGFPKEPDTGRLPGAPGALVEMEGFPAGKNSVLIYFSCENCAVEERRVTENGGKVHKSKFSIGEYGFISLVYDTEGNMIGLHSRV